MNDRSTTAFRLDRRADGFALLVVDVPGEPMNVLRAEFASELERVLDDIDRDETIRAVILISGKADGFIAGADLKLLRVIGSREKAEELSRSGQRALERVASSKKPFVAAIHGACLGGGLEVALACHARVATTDSRTRLGLPEVQLGLLPGLGGTQRLPRLVGLQAGLDLMLTGRQLDARRALKLGLVDEIVARPVLESAAIERALMLLAPRERRRTGLFDRRALEDTLLTKNPIGRKLVFEQARRQTRKKTRGNYPAPERILDVVETGLAHGAARGYDAETRAFGELAATPEARELINIFFATNELKKDPGIENPDVKPAEVHKVGVLGAGLMGAGVAYVTAAVAGIPVRLRDRDESALGKGLAQIRKVLDGRVKSRRLTAIERDRIMAQITPTVTYSGFRDAELVIEAVFEDLELKQRVLSDIEQYGHPNAIFASNTSSLPITKIAERARAPERVLGMHYFSPVEKMPLLEIVVTDRTADWVTRTAVAIGKRQGKTVIVVRDGPGFYTSRILGPYLNEAAYLLADGYAVDVIDDAVVHFGFPVGPLALLDEVGIDVGAKVGKILHSAFGPRMAPPPVVEQLLADERRGRKNERGLYVYGQKRRKGKKQVDTSVYQVLGVQPSRDAPIADVSHRCVLMMVNEAVRCLDEGILRSARDGDIGAVYGLGFPPFRGGPFRYVDAVGARDVVERLEAYASQFGSRFEPAPLLTDMARRGTSFHGMRRTETVNAQASATL